MNRKLVFRSIVALTGVALSAVATEAAAGWPWNHHARSTAVVQPAYAASYQPAYATYYRAPVVAATGVQVMQYMPYTAYRTQYVRVPVTAYRPVTGCNPCGGAVTALRPYPMQSWQVRLVPYTSYRIGYANACAPACATTGYAAPVAAPACCGTTSYPGVSASYTTPVYGNGATNGSVIYDPASSQPVLNGISTGGISTGGISTGGISTGGALSGSPTAADAATSQTYAEGANGQPEAQLKPIPDRNMSEPKSEGTNASGSSGGSDEGPMIPDPDARSTRRDARRLWAYGPVSWPRGEAGRSSPAVEQPQWRASSR